MKTAKVALFALSATLFACDADDSDVAARIDELGNTSDAGAAHDGAVAPGHDGKEGKHKDWEALLAGVEPRLKDCADGQIAAIVTAANKGEVALSKALRPKLTDPSAQKLADHLVEEHTKAQTELEAVLSKAGIQPVENANSAHLTEMNELTLAALQKKTGDELDTHFVTHQLVNHAQVIGTLDHVLIPSVKNAELKKYLQKTRKDVGEHTVDIAKAQTDVAGACGGDLTKDGGGKPPSPPSRDAGAQPPAHDAGAQTPGQDAGTTPSTGGPSVTDVNRQ